ncbi:hypothetical protein [endosymbiont of Ridgeia piscesae]|jgi:hypothetical protein|uniref:Uncharacterized protein n=1 Tax=endosymbiont of Ridgeia piscesae TaxID=54398 RepID=A0A0T5YXK1_9GAMM|nr:hypothetical protein [endosymbiont of Ridgeia piscesae]KRT55306.1 hypothetical protein Ga0074115_11664 [endosymbiont of Ridgeia piscesae]KRT60052.1 hypothetical protein Ga0076813_164717 [endosymbiont of Ridgeia piscesae]
MIRTRNDERDISSYVITSMVMFALLGVILTGKLLFWGVHNLLN